jgi:Methyltransferase domain
MTTETTIPPSLASLATNGRKSVAGSASVGANEKGKWYRGCIFGLLVGIVVGAQIFGTDLRLALLSVPPSHSGTADSTSSIGTRSPTLNNASTTRDGFQLAYTQSFGFFDNIPDLEWTKFYRKPALYRESHQHRVKTPLRDWKNPPIFLMNNYEPVFTCPYQKRVGGVGDGPKW